MLKTIETIPRTAEPSPVQRLKTGGFSLARLARMHDTLRRHVDGGRLPGLVALLSRRGAEHVDAIGTLAFDRMAPMRRDTIFRLASVTKPITAVAAMILIEECRLRLDDPVDEFLPELANRRVLRTIESELDDTVPAKRPITVRDLLTYRSGYGEVAFLSPACPLQRALIEARLPLSAMFTGPPDEFMRILGSLPLASQPGERWLYHMSAEILGVLIARVAGMPLSAFLRERILEPLGMKDSGFTVPEAKLDRVATCYQTDFSTGEITVLEDAGNDLLARPCLFESGAGDQFVSTADDLLAFGRMMLNRGVYGKERILSRLSVEVMTTDQLTPEQKAASPFFEGFWDARGWGLGLSIVTRRNEVAGVAGRFGWDGAFSTSLYVDPREDMVGILMAQCRPGALRLPPVVLDFWTSAYQAIDD
ncbi:MAG TPA: serine hydrolase domain-containing protein [Thermoanaerobaculia bacterium]